MQRELGRFGHGTKEESQPGCCKPTWRQVVLDNWTDECANVERAETTVQDGKANKEADVTDSINDECTFIGLCSSIFGKPEPDKEVGGKTDEFPANIHEQQVIGNDQSQHGRTEEAEVGPVPVDA